MNFILKFLPLRILSSILSFSIFFFFSTKIFAAETRVTASTQIQRYIRGRSIMITIWYTVLLYVFVGLKLVMMFLFCFVICGQERTGLHEPIQVSSKSFMYIKYKQDRTVKIKRVVNLIIPFLSSSSRSSSTTETYKVAAASTRSIYFYRSGWMDGLIIKAPI